MIWDYVTNMAGFIVTISQAGWYMIPTLGWHQALDAWAATKMKDFE